MPVNVYNIPCVSVAPIKRLRYPKMIPRRDIVNFLETSRNVGKSAKLANDNGISDRDMLFRCFSVFRELADLMEQAGDTVSEPKISLSAREKVAQTMYTSSNLILSFVADCQKSMQGGKPLYFDNLMAYMESEDNEI